MKIRYGVAEAGILRKEYGSKEHALYEMRRLLEEEKLLHNDHPDWSWTSYQLMVNEGDGWRLAKTEEYNIEREMDLEWFEKKFGDILCVR